MRVVLTRPPLYFKKNNINPAVSLPIGLLSIAAYLRENKFPVNVYDAQINKRKPIFVDDNNNYYFGESWDKIKLFFEKNYVDIVFLSSAYTVQKKSVHKMIKIIRKVSPRTFIVVGGAHATVLSEEFLKAQYRADIVCLGEGEETALEILQRYSESKSLFDIKGTAVLINGAIVENESRDFISDLDKLSFPAYDLVNMEDYFYLLNKGFEFRPSLPTLHHKRSVSLVSSRGCPYNCIFCSIHSQMGHQWRGHSVEYVLDHLEFLVSEYKINHVHFEDDNLTFDKKRFINLLQGFVDRDFSFSWDTPNGIRIDSLDESLIKKISTSNCEHLTFGIESGSQEVLDRIVNKKLNLEKAVEIFSICEKEKINTSAFYIVGFPQESLDQIRKTFDFALENMKKYKVFPALNIVSPLPGTRLLEKLNDIGLDLEASTSFPISEVKLRKVFDVEGVEKLYQSYLFKKNSITISILLRFFVSKPLKMIKIIVILLKAMLNKKEILKELYYIVNCRNNL